MDRPARRRSSLLRRSFATTAAIMLGAWAFLAFTPATIKSPLAVWEGIVGLAAVLAVLGLNLMLMRRAFGPLTKLTALTRRVDPLRPGQRIAIDGGGSEVADLTAAFNAMLERLERERRESAQRIHEAQEDERRRLARELHDEIGQSLTALLLQLEHASRIASPPASGELEEARETARASLEEVRRVARQLRPEALDDLGLRSALTNLVDRVSATAGLRIDRSFSRDLPRLAPDCELAIYRVAQESLTNVVRHASASRARVELAPANDGVLLRVADDGVGPNGASEGGGITGMRERAIMIGAHLDVCASDDGGFEVRLLVPAGDG